MVGVSGDLVLDDGGELGQGGVDVGAGDGGIGGDVDRALDGDANLIGGRSCAEDGQDGGAADHGQGDGAGGEFHGGVHEGNQFAFLAGEDAVALNHYDLVGS